METPCRPEAVLQFLAVAIGSQRYSTSITQWRFQDTVVTDSEFGLKKSSDINLFLSRCQIIGKASQQVYEALGNACTKDTKHQAHYYVEVEQAVVDEEHGSQVKFNMTFTQLTLAGAADKSDLVMDSKISDAVALGSKCAATLFKGHLAQTLKRQLDPIPAPTGKKVKKNVRYQMPTPAIIPSLNLLISLLQATMIPLALDLKDSMRTDFCNYLCRYYRQPPQETTCVCVLEDTDSCRNVIYPSTSAVNAQRR